MAIWVQVHDLPIGFMSKVVGNHLGNFIGEFLEYDEKNNTGVWRAFMRIRVKIGVRVPLKKEKKNLKNQWRV